MLRLSPIDHFTFYHQSKGFSPSFIRQSSSLMAFSQVMSMNSSYDIRNSLPVSQGLPLRNDVMTNDIYFYITLFRFKCIHAKVFPYPSDFKLLLKMLRYL